MRRARVQLRPNIAVGVKKDAAPAPAAPPVEEHVTPAAEASVVEEPAVVREPTPAPVREYCAPVKKRCLHCQSSHEFRRADFSYASHRSSNVCRIEAGCSASDSHHFATINVFRCDAQVR